MTSTNSKSSEVSEKPLVSGRQKAFVFARGFLAGISLIYLALVFLLWNNQEDLLFHPAAGPFPPPAAARLVDFHTEFMSVDGHRVGFLLSPPRTGMPVILLFHGNAGTAADSGWIMKDYVRDGWGVVLAEYSGWTGNEGGPPGEVSMRRDGLAYADWSRHQYPNSPLVVWGESMGTGIAAGVAASRPVIAVVLDSPYTSIAEIAGRSYWWLPVPVLLRHPFDTMVLLPRISAPIAVVHGEVDWLVPSDMGHTVWNAAALKGPGIFIPTANHMPTLQDDVEGRVARVKLREFLDKVREKESEFSPNFHR